MSFIGFVLAVLVVVTLLAAVISFVATSGRFASPVMGLRNLSLSFVFSGVLVYVLRQENSVDYLAKQDGVSWGNLPEAAYLAPLLTGIVLMAISGAVALARARKDT